MPDFDTRNLHPRRAGRQGHGIGSRITACDLELQRHEIPVVTATQPADGPPAGLGGFTADAHGKRGGRILGERIDLDRRNRPPKPIHQRRIRFHAGAGGVLLGHAGVGGHDLNSPGAVGQAAEILELVDEYAVLGTCRPDGSRHRGGTRRVDSGRAIPPRSAGLGCFISMQRTILRTVLSGIGGDDLPRSCRGGRTLHYVPDRPD